MNYSVDDAEAFEQAWLLLVEIYIQGGKYDLAQELALLFQSALIFRAERNAVQNASGGGRFQQNIFPQFRLLSQPFVRDSRLGLFETQKRDRNPESGVEFATNDSRGVS